MDLIILISSSTLEPTNYSVIIYRIYSISQYILSVKVLTCYVCVFSKKWVFLSKGELGPNSADNIGFSDLSESISYPKFMEFWHL